MNAKVVSLSTSTRSSGSMMNANLRAPALLFFATFCRPLPIVKQPLCYADRCQSRRLAPEAIRPEPGCDEPGLRYLRAFVVVEIALRSDRYQYRTRMRASNQPGDRLATLRANDGERLGGHTANHVVDTD